VSKNECCLCGGTTSRTLESLKNSGWNFCRLHCPVQRTFLFCPMHTAEEITEKIQEEVTAGQ